MTGFVGKTPRIGCAGWAVPAAYAALFGPGDSVLARYATRFNAVEINSSFYRPHQHKTYVRWAGSVPRDFRFSVKMPKAITHENRLQRTGMALDRFVDEIGGLGNKLAGVLVQLPPSLALDARVASTFFAMLRRRLSANIACEPRHASWFTAKGDALWRQFDIARVAADPAIEAAARVPAGAGQWRYWRWHGAPRIYYSAYEEDALRALAAAIRESGANLAFSWVIFDNTALGHAVANAAWLQEYLERPA